ncbi:MAG: hypothetical protein ACKOFX_00295 [Solirubrobacterales bacterium]
MPLVAKGTKAGVSTGPWPVFSRPVLAALGIAQPPEMTGHSLIVDS